MTVSSSAQRDATLTPRLKSALLWGVVGALCFLVLHQGYLLLDGEFLGVRPVAAVGVGVFVVTVVASYFTAGQLEMFEPDEAVVDSTGAEQPESGTAPGSVPGTEPESDSGRGSMPKSEPEQGSTAVSGSAPEPSSEPPSATASGSGPEPERGGETEAEPQSETASVPEAEPDPSPEPEPEPEADAEAEATEPVADGSVGQGIVEAETADEDAEEQTSEDEWIWGEPDADG